MNQKNEISSISYSKSKLFFLFLKIGTIGFGGGSALIPVIERELVGAQKPLEAEEYLKYTVVSEMTPGALPVKIGAACGFRLAGPVGALLGAYGALLPGVVLTVFIMSLFSLMGEKAVALFQFASVGISAFIIMLLVSYVKRICGEGPGKRNWLLCATSFFLTCGKEIREVAGQIFPSSYMVHTEPLFNISTIDLMIITFLGLISLSIGMCRAARCGVFALCACYCLCKGNVGKSLGLASLSQFLLLIVGLLILFCVVADRKKANRSACVAITKSAAFSITLFLVIALIGVLLAGLLLDSNVWKFLCTVGLSAITSFGGGEAYVSVADGFFVQNGYIGTDAYYTQLVPVANALPGPILVKIAAGVGYVFGSEGFGCSCGWICAASAAMMASGACCSIMIAAVQIYESIEHSNLVQNLRQYILPVICGLLLSTSCSMLYEASKITAEKGIPAIITFVFVGGWVVLLRFLHRLPDLALLIASATISLSVLVLL